MHASTSSLSPFLLSLSLSTFIIPSAVFALPQPQLQQQTTVITSVVTPPPSTTLITLVSIHATEVQSEAPEAIITATFSVDASVPISSSTVANSTSSNTTTTSPFASLLPALATSSLVISNMTTINITLSTAITISPSLNTTFTFLLPAFANNTMTLNSTSSGSIDPTIVTATGTPTPNGPSTITSFTVVQPTANLLPASQSGAVATGPAGLAKSAAGGSQWEGVKEVRLRGVVVGMLAVAGVFCFA